MRNTADQKHELYVTGSGPVWVPKARLNEISKVISERHSLDSERAIQVGRYLRRAV